MTEPLTIDMTPTWVELMPLLIEVAANGDTTEGRREAKSELMRLARAVDARRAPVKAEPSGFTVVVARPDYISDGPGDVFVTHVSVEDHLEAERLACREAWEADQPDDEDLDQQEDQTAGYLAILTFRGCQNAI